MSTANETVTRTQDYSLLLLEVTAVAAPPAPSMLCRNNQSSLRILPLWEPKRKKGYLLPFVSGVREKILWPLMGEDSSKSHLATAFIF